MSTSAHLLSIQALKDWRAALLRFAEQARKALDQTAREVQRTLDWLAERQQHWRNEVHRRQEILARANAALEACRAGGYYNPKTGAYYEPPCPAQWQAVRRAQALLAEAERELETVQRWTRSVQQQVAAFEHQAQRLSAYLANDLPRATARLEHKITTLEAYAAMGAPASTSIPAASFAATPPIQAAGDWFTASVGMAAVSIGLVGAAIAVIRLLSGDIRHALGAVGEQLSANLLESLALQEIPFDQARHGFDRVFTAPGLPLIVMESKVTQSGRFHPSQTQHGEQGSSEWVAAQAQRMDDPASAQWSPTNERIGALIRELKPENVPAVAVVIQSTSGAAGVYFRPADADDWQVLREGVSLAEALSGGSDSKVGLDGAGSVGKERSAEAPGGSVSRDQS